MVVLREGVVADHVVSVDLGGTKMIAGIGDSEGKLRGMLRWPTHEADDSVVDRLVRLIRVAVDKSGMPWERVGAIGVGAPGVTDVKQGVVKWAPNLRWRDVRLKEILESEFDVPVVVDNDVNMMAFGEYRYGSRKCSDPFVCLAIGTGVGGCTIVGGRVLRGFHNFAGEFGYMVMDREHLGNRYLDRGCLEMLISGYGIASRAKALYPTGTNKAAVDVFREARNGNPKAMMFAEEVADYLTMAIVNIASVVDPEVVVLGGGVVDASDLFLGRVCSCVQTLVPSPPEIVVSGLGQDAGVLGGVAAAWEVAVDSSYDFGCSS